jgi:hypothetical protein
MRGYPERSTVEERTQEKKSFVYMISNREGDQFKLGKSNSPELRSRGFAAYAQLDLDQSIQVQYSNSKRASQIERALHKALEPYRVARSEFPQGDGCTEWFHMSAWSVAIDLIKLLPDEANGSLGEIQKFSGGTYIDSEPIHQFGHRVLKQMRRKVEFQAHESFVKIEEIFQSLNEMRINKEISIFVESVDDQRITIKIVDLNYSNLVDAYFLRAQIMKLENYEISYLDKETIKKHSILKTIARLDSKKDDLVLTMDSPNGLANVLRTSSICKRWKRVVDDLQLEHNSRDCSMDKWLKWVV